MEPISQKEALGETDMKKGGLEACRTVNALQMLPDCGEPTAGIRNVCKNTPVQLFLGSSEPSAEIVPVAVQFLKCRATVRCSQRTSSPKQYAAVLSSSQMAHGSILSILHLLRVVHIDICRA